MLSSDSWLSCPGLAWKRRPVPAPNPASRETRIGFSLPHAGRVRVVLHDLAGARVRTLLDESRAAGPGQVVWNGRDDHGTPVTPGAYFYRLEFEGQTLHQRLVWMR